MRISAWFGAAAIAVAGVGAAAGAAHAQGQGYGVGEWRLRSGNSVCFLTLTNRYLPQFANYRARLRGGSDCRDWRVRSIAMWVVRGNSLKLSDRNGSEIASLDEQNPNLYANGGWRMRRAGAGPGPGPRPGPQSVRFTYPRINNAAVDWCATWANNCGDGGARLYCQRRGFRGAADWSRYMATRSYVIGSNRYCVGSCGAFSHVTCVR